MQFKVKQEIFKILQLSYQWKSEKVNDIDICFRKIKTRLPISFLLVSITVKST